jgi:multiple RNA-binding domain-containing protein 1
LFTVLCRSAFKALAYKKYQQVPLYLEWAPKDIWDTPAPAAAANKPAAAAGDSKAAAASAAGAAAAADAADAAAASKPTAAAGDEGDEDDDGPEAPVACIYVKNLNFATGDAALRKHFDKAVSAAGGSIHSAKVRRSAVWHCWRQNARDNTHGPTSCCEISVHAGTCSCGVCGL